MRAEQTGVVVARGIGLGLIVLGACAGIGNFTFFQPAASGWTSYSPSATTTTTTASIWSVSYNATVHVWLPAVAQLLVGSAMILFSKPVGCWLALGLKDSEKE